MRRFLTLLLAGAFLILAALPAAAARPVVSYPVTFNGHPVTFDVAPEVIPPGHTMVPFRAIFEKMGADVSYDSATSTVTAKRGTTTVALTIGKTTAFVNGQAKTLAAAPYTKNGRTMVPLRFVGEAFGAEVSYNPATTAISIVDKNWPKRGGTLNLAMWNKPSGKFNPIISDDTYTSNITSLVFSGLWRYDERVTPIPNIAESWEWDKSLTTLTMYLRKDVKFHDGTPLTAKDVLFTFKAIWHPKYIGARNVGFDDIIGYEDYHNGIKGETPADFQKGIVTPTPLEGLYAPDNYTIVWKLKQPNVTFIYNIPYGIMDHTKYTNVPVQNFGLAADPNTNRPNGAGPFKLQSMSEGQNYILTAYDDFHRGRPYIDRIIYRVLSSDVAVGEMSRGTLDFADFNATEYASYKALKNINITEYPDIVYQYMGFNTVEGFASDKKVRQAIAFAIDRNVIIHNLMEDHGSALYTPIHPLTWAFTNDVEQYTFNKNKAAQLLDEAGWKVGAGGIREKNGQKLHLRLLYPNVGNQVRIRTAPVVQQMLKDVGIEVELQGFDFTTVQLKAFTEYDFDLYFIGMVLGNTDPDPTGVWNKGAIAPGAFNGTRWWSERSEELIAKGVQTADIDERMEIYHEWQRHFADEMPAYFFYASNAMMATSKRLQNFKPGVQGEMWNLEELWLSE